MIVKRYKDDWQIRVTKKGQYYLYRTGYNRLNCDSLKDARFTHFTLWK